MDVNIDCTGLLKKKKHLKNTKWWQIFNKDTLTSEILQFVHKLFM